LGSNLIIAQFELGCVSIKRPKKGPQNQIGPKKSVGCKMGQKLLETQIAPQNTWAKSYVALMIRQLPPWRTHGDLNL
jgi:hypothetical protein